jgi:AraC-like DNA-binding protein
MSHRAEASPDSSDWLPAAEFYDHRLNASHPVILLGGEAEVAPLQVHIHKGIDLGVLLAGTMELIHGDFHQRLRAGDVWLTAMWEPHAWRVARPGSSNVCFTFLPGVLENTIEDELGLLDMFLTPASERPQVTDDKLRSEVLEIGWAAFREHALQPWGASSTDHSGPAPLGHETMATTHLLQLLVTLRRSWTPPARLPSRSRQFASNVGRVTPALTLVHSNLGRRVSVGEAAAACGMSRAWFHRLFAETMGMTFGRFSLRARLGVVARQLLDTDLSVESIALQSGFADASHLHHSFVHHYGVTPAAFRARSRS